MNTEELRVKAKIDRQAFKRRIENLDVSEVKNFSDFVITVDELREETVIRAQTLKKPRFVPKPFWNDEIKRLQGRKNSPW